MYIYHIKTVYAMIAKRGFNLDSYALLILGVLIGSIAYTITYLSLNIIFKLQMKVWYFILIGYIISLFLWIACIYILTPIMNIT